MAKGIESRWEDDDLKGTRVYNSLDEYFEDEESQKEILDKIEDDTSKEDN